MRKSPAPPLTPEQTQTMIDMLPHVTSVRDIAVLLGLPQSTVNAHAKPFIALMKMQGVLPKCGCGRDRFHRYGCRDSVAKIRATGAVPGRSAAQAQAVLDRRAAILDAIMTGAPYSQIDERFGLAPKSVRKYLRYLTPEQVAHRKRLERSRTAKPEPTRPFDGARLPSALRGNAAPAGCRQHQQELRL